jgi:tRNA threonylcarbamoyladenosine biosynthesis protein TsaB
MLILALDTSSANGSVALLRDNAIVSQRAISAGEPYSGSLLRETKLLLDGARISFEQIELFAVDAGPGSFTGLRVGLTTVKGWAEVWGRPIAAVSGLAAMATQLSGLPASSLIAAVMDARRGQVFAAAFRRGNDGSEALASLGEEVVTSAEQFLESLRPQVGSAGEVVVACIQPEIIRTAVASQNCRCRIDVVSDVLAPFIGLLGYAKARRGELVDALHLDANYIRRSDAEMNWKAG